MTWVNLDDQMPEHPKIISLSDAAFRLHISAIAYCNRHLTDGLIPGQAVAKLVPTYRSRQLAELLQNGLWSEAASNSGAYEIHDYLDWNKSRADVEKRRQARSEGGREGANRRWHNP